MSILCLCFIFCFLLYSICNITSSISHFYCFPLSISVTLIAVLLFISVSHISSVLCIVLFCFSVWFQILMHWITAFAGQFYILMVLQAMALFVCSYLISVETKYNCNFFGACSWFLKYNIFSWMQSTIVVCHAWWIFENICCTMPS